MAFLLITCILQKWLTIAAIVSETLPIISHGNTHVTDVSKSASLFNANSVSRSELSIPDLTWAVNVVNIFNGSAACTINYSSNYNEFTIQYPSFDLKFEETKYVFVPPNSTFSIDVSNEIVSVHHEFSLFGEGNSLVLIGHIYDVNFNLYLPQVSSITRPSSLPSYVAANSYDSPLRVCLDDHTQQSCGDILNNYYVYWVLSDSSSTSKIPNPVNFYAYQLIGSDYTYLQGIYFDQVVPANSTYFLVFYGNNKSISACYGCFKYNFTTPTPVYFSDPFKKIIRNPFLDYVAYMSGVVLFFRVLVTLFGIWGRIDRFRKSTKLSVGQPGQNVLVLGLPRITIFMNSKYALLYCLFPHILSGILNIYDTATDKKTTSIHNDTMYVVILIGTLYTLPLFSLLAFCFPINLMIFQFSHIVLYPVTLVLTFIRLYGNHLTISIAISIVYNMWVVSITAIIVFFVLLMIIWTIFSISIIILEMPFMYLLRRNESIFSSNIGFITKYWGVCLAMIAHVIDVSLPIFLFKNCDSPAQQPSYEMYNFKYTDNNWFFNLIERVYVISPLFHESEILYYDISSKRWYLKTVLHDTERSDFESNTVNNVTNTKNKQVYTIEESNDKF